MKKTGRVSQAGSMEVRNHMMCSQSSEGSGVSGPQCQGRKWDKLRCRGR